MPNINPKPQAYYAVFGDFGTEGVEAVCDGALTTREQVIEVIEALIGDDTPPARIHHIDIIAGRCSDSTLHFASDLIDCGKQAVEDWAVSILAVYRPQLFTANAMLRRALGEAA